MLAPKRRGVALLAALLTTAAATMIAESAFAGGRTGGHGAYAAPPYYSGPDRSRGTTIQTDGSSISFNSGGSGRKPTKKPSLQ